MKKGIKKENNYYVFNFTRTIIYWFNLKLTFNV